MGFDDSEMHDIFSGRAKTRSPNIQIDVIILEKEHKHLTIRSDESSPIRKIPRRGVSIKSERPPYAVLSMTEERALDMNLI